MTDIRRQIVNHQNIHSQLFMHEYKQVVHMGVGCEGCKREQGAIEVKTINSDMRNPKIQKPLGESVKES